MILYTNQKPIVEINFYDMMDETFKKTPYRSEAYAYPMSYNTAVDTILKQHTDEVPDEGTLFFDKSSAFPRNLLEGSPYKRTIKLNKCDYFVINVDNLKKHYLNYDNGRTVTIFETEDENIVIDGLGSTKGQYYHSRFFDKYSISLDDLEAMKQFLISHNVFDGNVIVNEDVKLYPASNTAQARVIEAVLNGVYNGYKYITDKELSSKVSSTRENITEDDLNSIIDMLNSSDNEVVSLALKMLPTYNVLPYKYSVTTILHLFYRKIFENPIYNSVAFVNMKADLDYKIPPYVDFPANIWKINETKARLNPTQEDADFSFNLTEKMFQELYDKLVADFDKLPVY